MRKFVCLIGLATLCGCTSITRTAVQPDGTQITYRLDSMLNNKTIKGLKLRDCSGCVDLSLTDYASNQDAALQVLKAALDAYLSTMSAGVK